LVLACGALVAELRAVLGEQGLSDAVEVRYLPAALHNRPERIVPALQAELATLAPSDDSDTSPAHPDQTAQTRGEDRRVLIGYADCGTGGLLDAWIDTMSNVTRLPGAHCYELFSGAQLFAAMHDEAPGTFYLTDFLARHFDALVWQGLGLGRHPELRDAYFGNYTRLMLISQSTDPAVIESGRQAAGRLGLAFEHRHVGRSRLGQAVAVGITREQVRSASR
jgi:Protein of unknown function (DUF1638)